MEKVEIFRHEHGNDVLTTELCYAMLNGGQITIRVQIRLNGHLIHEWKLQTEGSGQWDEVKLLYNRIKSGLGS